MPQQVNQVFQIKQKDWLSIFAYANTIDSLQAFGDWKSAISSAFKVTPLHAAEYKLKHGHTANPTPANQFLALMWKDFSIHAYPQSS